MDDRLGHDEREFIEVIERQQQEEIDDSRVADILFDDNFDPIEMQSYRYQNPKKCNEAPSELLAAELIGLRRIGQYKDQFDEESILTSSAMMAAKVTIVTGLRMIRQYEEFYRFKPTVEAIFEFSDEEIDAAMDYFDALNDTGYRQPLSNSETRMLRKHQELQETDDLGDQIDLTKEIIESSAKIHERGLPNLLAIKRVLDGEFPEADSLQSMRLSDIRNELTDKSEKNSPYVDLVVEGYEPSLRNAIVHNDLMIDIVEKEVQVPNRNNTYSFDDISDAGRRAFTNGLFLASVLMCLVDWHYTTTGTTFRQEHYGERPNWIFKQDGVSDSLIAQNVSWLKN